MTPFTFEEYVAATLHSARKTVREDLLSLEDVQIIARYLASPGSGIDASSSFEQFLAQRMTDFPPKLPPGQSYVTFSGEQSSSISNFTFAREYTEQVGGGGHCGLIGDTPWGSFVNKAGANTEVDIIGKKFRTFLEDLDISPFGNNITAALQDIMWNIGSVPFIRNAMECGMPTVAFVENAPGQRGFALFEMPTALCYQNSIMNGYRMSAFGPPPPVREADGDE